MVERFRRIGEENMRDLPIFHDELDTEAIGFRRHTSGLMGVLITPWFMNVIFLPETKKKMDYTVVGNKSPVTTPSGEWEFTHGGDEEIGMYQSLSLHSPVFDFKTQELARIEALRRINALFRPPEDNESKSPRPDNPGRRAFFQGRSA